MFLIKLLEILSEKSYQRNLISLELTVKYHSTYHSTNYPYLQNTYAKKNNIYLNFENAYRRLRAFLPPFSTLLRDIVLIYLKNIVD